MFYKISKHNKVLFITYMYCKRGNDSNAVFSIDSILLQDKSLEKVKENYCLNYLLNI